MINLLPPQQKSQYRYAKANTILVRWLAALACVLVGLFLIGTYGVATLHKSTSTQNNQAVQLSAQLKKDNLEQTKSKVEDISRSVKLATSVLQQEVLFSKLLTQMGAAMPTGTSLAGLDINQIAGGLELKANAVSYQAATQIQVNLQDPANNLFSRVDIENITCPGATDGNPYACQAQLRGLFAANSSFLFINQNSTAAGAKK